MDIALEGEIDGIETTRRIREHAQVPVIFISGNPDCYNKDCLTEKEFAEFSAKPFNH
jgi:CheY-like chemotaxis protein